jgi:hypothetical protein
MLPNGDGGTLRLRVFYILIELELEERGKRRSDCSFEASKNDTSINKVRAEG